MKSKNSDTYIGIIEASEKLNLSQKIIRKHIVSGKISSIKIGGVYKIPMLVIENFSIAEDIENEFLMEEHSIKSKSKKKNRKRGNKLG